MGRDGIEIKPIALIYRCSKTRNRIVTPTVTPTCSEIPIFADRREETISATAAESNSGLCTAEVRANRNPHIYSI